jgi:signal transduction histidine kinase
MDDSLVQSRRLRDPSAIALILLRCNQAAANAANEPEALQSTCDLLVDNGLFRGASIGFNQAGKHKGSVASHCFLLNVDGQLLGALTVSSADPDAFQPELVELFTRWSEAFAPLIAAARRRALHGRANVWSEPGGDIEDLKRTEAALRRSEGFLNKAQRLSLTGSFGWKAASTGIDWSDETFRIFAYEPESISPTWDHVLQRVHPEDCARARELIERARRDGEDFQSELRLLMPDGAVKHVLMVAQAIGCPVTGEFVGAVMDITASRAMEQALAFRDQVMGILGHDLRNPLSAVSGIAGLAKLSNELSETGRTQMTQIERAAYRMRELIETLLDFTQTRFAGKLPISPTTTDLREVCGRVVGELAAGHPRRTIDVEAHGDATGTWDPGRIAQVVSNLVGNALTHGDPSAPVHLSIDGEQREVALKVHNSGRPIQAEQVPALFEPFHRGGAPDDDLTSPRGLGLGLHIAKQIVLAHGGSISVQSSADEGTTFCVDLPRQPPAAAGVSTNSGGC